MAVIERTDEQIVGGRANNNPAMLRLIIKALSIGSWNNTAEENARLAAAKRLLAKKER
jgi:hypothetical protein